MSQTSPPRPLTAWARLAVWLGFLAVLSALVAPATLLAEEVRTGKLGGLCSVSSSTASPADAGDGGVASTGSHCDWCVSLSLAPPAGSASAGLPLAAGNTLVLAYSPGVPASYVTGLQFSRGPPVL